MKIIQKALLFTLLITCTSYSCKKKTENIEEKPVVVTTTTTGGTPTHTVSSHPICDGTDSNSYYPLDSSNTWIYSREYNSSMLSSRPCPSIVGFRTFNSVKYAKLIDSTQTYADIYLRKDSLTNDIYLRYNNNSIPEGLYIPASPVLNQTWAMPQSGLRKVTSLSASIITDSCSYHDLLEITQLSSATNEVIRKTYFKKGIGIVYEETFSFPNKYRLIGVKLK